MTKFRITDTTIGADYGIVVTDSSSAALDYIVLKMGWGSYEEYTAAAAKHFGARTLTATEVPARQPSKVQATATP